jgi:hypothetical protein
MPLFLGLLAAGGVSAQSVRVTATVSEPTIGTEETVAFTINVSSNALPEMATPGPPEVEGLVLASRFPSSSTNISIVNGRMEQTVGYTWTFRPSKEGTAVFRPITIRIGDNEFRTDRITVEVVPQSQRPARRQRPRSLFDPLLAPDPEPERDITAEDMFINAAPSKRRAYQNEQITVEYALFFRPGIQLRQSRLVDSWDAEGFWREELEVETRALPETVVRNGIQYSRIVLKRIGVFPTRSGRLTIDPLKIETEASVPYGSRDPFFSLRNRYQPVRLESEPITLDVVPLPAEAPVSFTGAVGAFDFEVAIDRRRVEVGESVQVRARISGSGNVATIDGPSFQPPGVFELYDPEVGTRVDRGGRSIRGQKTFEYILVPRSNGTFEIPSLEFSYFAPQTGRYETIRSEPVQILVSGSASDAPPLLATASGLPVDDIAPVILQSDDWSTVRSTPLHRRMLPYSVLVLPILLIAGLRVYLHHAARLATDQRYARFKRAHPLARKHLRQAEALLAENDTADFYAEVERAVTGFIGDRLNIGHLALNRNELLQHLAERGVDRQTTELVEKVLADCEQARFSPTRPSAEQMEKTRDLSAGLIVALDRSLAASTRNGESS